jgi:hypothetical protein
MLTVSHSHRCNEMWMQNSVYVGTEICFSYALRKQRCGSLGLRLSPKHNTHPARILRRNPQFYSANNSTDSGKCWNPNWVIRRLEAGSKAMGSLCIRGIQFRVTIFYICVQYCLMIFLPEILFKQILKMNQCFLPFWPKDVSPVRRWPFPNSHINIAMSLCTSPHLIAWNSMMATGSVCSKTDFVVN